MTYAQRMPDWLAKRAVLSGGQLALQYEDQAITFAELDAQVQSLASSLGDSGIRAGEHVAVLLPNNPYFVWTMHALARLGAVAVPLNLRLTVAELAVQLADAEVRWLLYHSETATAAERLIVGTAAQGMCLDVEEERQGQGQGQGQGQLQNESASTGHFELSRVHTIIFTSGTTGRPKGAQLTYSNHWWSAMGSVLNLGLRGDDVWLACLPLFHVGGLSILLRSVIYGIPVVLQPRFDPDAVNQALDRHGVTTISVVSSMLARMLDARGDKPYPASLRCVLVGGGPVPSALLERCHSLGVPVVQTYGLTETASQVVTLSPSDALRKLGSAGKPLFPVDLRIEVDRRAANANEAGEIVLRAPNVMQGYYKRPAETQDVLRDGWLHTGDVGYVDDEGFLYVLDRRADLFISGGENVYPAEIEAALHTHEAVEEVAVIGQPDTTWGQVPVAYVKVRANYMATEDQLIAHAQERLARYKIPRHIHFVEKLPRNAAGKLLRRSLREQVGPE